MTQVIYFDGSTKLKCICICTINNVKKLLSFDGSLTNNQLEYYGLIFALRFINKKIKGKTISVRGDSKLVVDVVNNRKNVVNDKLMILNEQAKEEINYGIHHNNNDIFIEWVPRLQNKAGIILDKEMKK